MTLPHPHRAAQRTTFRSLPGEIAGDPVGASGTVQHRGEGGRGGHCTVRQVYRPTVKLERLKLRRGPRPTVSVVAVLLVQV